MKMRVCCLLSFVCLLSLKGFSTHIIGGEIFYDCLGNNNYRINIKMYRDCINGVPPFDNPASIGVYDANGNLVQNILVNFFGSIKVPYINNACINPPANVCVEQTIYTTIINLPPIAGGYTLSYQRCCRNHTILNLANPGDVGTTYTCHIPDPSIAGCNSSPRFTNFPPIFICAGIPLNFDHSATDPDGDSLVYELADPFDGASKNDPKPQPPAAPPYFSVPWIPPYNAQNPMSASPAMALNSATGMLTGTPNMLGQWVVGVRVKEYRNKQLISSNIRDFQFNVMNCPPVPPPTYNPPPLTGCAPFTVQFSDSSFRSQFISNILWDFGDGSPFTIGTSSLNSPSHVYTFPGVYTVTLKFTHKCIGNFTFTISNMVTVHPSPKAGMSANPTTISVMEPTITFTNLSEGSNKCWIYFGDGDSSDNCSVTHTYDVTGAYYTVLQVVENQYGCKDYYKLEIPIAPLFWIPNAFTPNTDGRNEFFLPLAMGIQNFHFMLFDRWGNKIFETRDLETGWDGTFKGSPCQEDVYVWKVEYENAGEHKTKHNQVGHVTLVR